MVFVVVGRLHPKLSTGLQQRDACFPKRRLEPFRLLALARRSLCKTPVICGRTAARKVNPPAAMATRTVLSAIAVLSPRSYGTLTIYLKADGGYGQYKMLVSDRTSRVEQLTSPPG